MTAAEHFAQARLVPPSELKAQPVLAALLRLMEAHPNVARRSAVDPRSVVIRLPKYRPDETWPSTLCAALRDVREDFPAAVLPSSQLLPWAYWTFAPRIPA